MVTMSDVAQVAGVSQTTVSHVLNKTRRIAPETERAVAAAIEATGYLNDGIAKSLRTGKTHSIGLAISAMSNPYFGEVVHSIEKHVTDLGYSLLLADTHDDPDRELRAVRDLLAHRPDGIILAPSADPQEALRQISRRKIPTILIDRVPEHLDPSQPVDAIGVENTEPTAELVRHLAERGHRRIAMVSGRPGLRTTLERVDGYLLGLRQAGIGVDETLIRDGHSEAEPARQAIKSLMALKSPPTALITGNNQMTIGAMAALRDLGLQVPDDIALVAFDDFPWADLFHPRLTVMAQPIEELGTLAAEMLFQRLQEPDLKPREIRLSPRLIVRDSGGTGI
ncbi:LacI family DNA-binding transcriptional regulator [Pseudarthrobacter albicanus]|uniref:LacI family DNA-binding transcriptional regulator n=1 Tax=Pseudarthrobacter albicanus TaxID=2823873 RepID=UPI001BA693A7|nr:LacI family DNA-binding transcriptional regulator [Pseudarthrobacter albicanus]